MNPKFEIESRLGAYALKLLKCLESATPLCGDLSESEVRTSEFGPE
jgi:hypothetical protein